MKQYPPCHSLPLPFQLGFCCTIKPICYWSTIWLTWPRSYLFNLLGWRSSFISWRVAPLMCQHCKANLITFNMEIFASPSCGQTVPSERAASLSFCTTTLVVYGLAQSTSSNLFWHVISPDVERCYIICPVHHPSIYDIFKYTYEAISSRNPAHEVSLTGRFSSFPTDFHGIFSPADSSAPSASRRDL